MKRPRSTSALLTVAAALLGALGGAVPALAQDAAGPPLEVAVDAVGEGGAAGLALVSRADAGTTIQILATGAPQGTTAVVHPGSCDAPDATLVALIGDVSGGELVQTVVPVPFETLTDGGHVIGLHPGLDMATLIACGAVPEVASASPGPTATLAPSATLAPTATIAPAVTLPPIDVPATLAPEVTLAPIPTLPPAPTVAPPTADPACAGVQDWIASTEARITRISEALSELNIIAGRFDLNGYLSGLAALDGELQVMIANQAQEFTPVVVADTNIQAIAAYETFIDAARQIYESMTTSVDIQTYSRAMGRYDEATKLIGDVQRSIGQLKGRCPTG